MASRFLVQRGSVLLSKNVTIKSCRQRSTNASSESNPLSRFFYWYGEKLETHPVITKGLTAGFIGAMGDVSCQFFIDKPEKEHKNKESRPKISGGEQHESQESAFWWFDAGRSGRFFTLGVVLVGPWCHAWFGFLARSLPKLTLPSIVSRVALDQFAFTPVILSTFVSSLWLLEDFMEAEENKAEKPSIPSRLRETLPDVLVANWMLWWPAQLINFRLVPQKYQVLFANMISLLWNAYVSFSTRTAPEVAPEVEEEILENAPIAVTLVQRMTKGVESAFTETIDAATSSGENND